MNSSPLLRLATAAGLYLLLMWGYIVLPSAQWYAAYLALIMCSMLVFWVSEATAEAVSSGHQKITQPPRIDASETNEHPGSIPSLDASIMRLDSLKSELTLQYAQFGRDQSLINSNGLGSWHRNRNPRAR